MKRNSHPYKVEIEGGGGGGGETYDDFTGATEMTAGEHGLVPAPKAGEQNKYLKGDGTWGTVSGGVPTNATFWGQSYDSVNNTVNGRIKSKDNSYTGSFAADYGDGGFEYYTTASNPIVIRVRKNTTSDHGRLQIDSTNGWAFFIDRNVVASIGTSGMDMKTHKISNVVDPQLAQDAATKNYVDSFYPVGTVYSSTSSTAPTIAGGTWIEIGTQTVGSATVHYYERTA